MTQKEIGVIIKILSETWDAKFSKTRAKIYAENLADLEYSRCCNAVKKLVQTSEFLPSIALIRRTYVELGQNFLDDVSAYELLKDAIQTFGIYSSKEGLQYLERQNETVYELAKKIGWRELCTCPESILSSQFIKIYQGFSQAKIKSEAISPKLSQELNEARSQITRACFKLLEGGETV